MRWLVGVVLVLAPLMGMPADEQCRQESYGTIPIELTPAGVVLVPAMSQGKVVWVLLDLSVGFSLIDAPAAKMLGLKPARIANANIRFGEKAVELQVKLPALRIGDLTLANWKFGVDPNSGKELNTTTRGIPYLGRIGTQLLSDADIELNLPERRIRLFKPVECGERAAYWGGEVTAQDFVVDSLGAVIFPMEIDGQLVKTTLSTIAARSSISEAVTHKFFGFDRTSEGMVRDSGSPAGTGLTFKAMSLTASGLQVRNVRMRLNEDRKGYCVPVREGGQGNPIGFASCIRYAPASLGTEVLQRLRIYIASREKRIYFTVPSTANSNATEGQIQ